MKMFGYNGLLFDGHKFTRPDELVSDGACLSEARKIAAYAKSLGIAIIPMTQSQAEASKKRHHLCEAFPMKNARFIVSGGSATHIGDTIALVNPGFESGATPWTGAKQFSIDNTVFRTGTASLCLGEPTGKLRSFGQTITVKPNTVYQVSGFIKTQRLTNSRDVGFAVQSKATGRWLYNPRVGQGRARNKNWSIHRITFFSQGATRVSLYLRAGPTKSASEKVWFDDIMVREVALHETVVRPGMEIKAKSLSGTVYREGKDYAFSFDPAVSKFNQGTLTIPSGSSIKNGDTLLVDWYSFADCNLKTPEASLMSDEAWQIISSNIIDIDTLFDTPVGRMMKYSEWRVSGWDPLTQARYPNTGAYWAWVVSRTESLYRVSNWNREVYIWNDEVDPSHNGEKGASQWLWKGNQGAWKGLSTETVILNWCAENKNDTTNSKRRNSMRFFAGIHPGKWYDPVAKDSVRKTNMQRQIIAAGAFQADTGRTGAWKKWLPLLNELENDPANPLPDGAVIGMLYHQYDGQYTELGIMRDSCMAEGRWQPQFPFTPRDVGMEPKKISADPMALSMHVCGNFIRYGLEYNGSVELKLMNTLGQTVRRLVIHKRQSRGKHEIRIDESRFPAGVYFLNLSVDRGESRIAKRIVLF